MDTTMMPQSMGQAPFYFYNSESKQQQQQMGAMYKPAHGMPGTPAYSRPGSSCSQPPTLYSNGPSVMTPTGSPPPTSHRPSIMLDTDLSCDSYFPATPPLSTAGSSMGSPQTGDALQTPMNPMFSGLDGLEGVKDGLESAETSVLDWSNCASPSMTPMYLQSQTSGQAPSVNTSDLLSTTSCPSLSPSPAPYARSIAASEQDVDFCDPRNLTVTSAPAATSNPTLVPECTAASPASEQLATKTQEAGAVAPQPTFDFDPAIPDGLPSFEELGNLESEDDFVNSLVNLGDSAPDVGRPRAGTGSSVVSLGHGSFIGEDDLDFDDNEVFQLPSLPTPISTDDDSHKDKRQKKIHKKDERTLAPAMTQAAGAAEEVDTQQSPQKSDDGAASDSNASSGSESGNAQVTAPTSRRGRKQSLTEDPSKTFVCDLCSRRFRRQEHLKRHYRSLHTQEKPFECNECGKKFSRSDNLAQHARTHAGGAIVMNLIDENGAPTYDPSMAPAPSGEDYGTYGKVLFQIASEVPGSASEPSSEEEKDDGKKKRKRSD